MTYQRVNQDTQNTIDGVYKSTEEQHDLGIDRTIFQALLEADIPPEDKKHSRLSQEAKVVIGAGADTTAHALAMTQFHILDNPDIHKKLQAELEGALPNKYDPVELRIVEQLPYLVSTVSSQGNKRIKRINFFT
jgi:cytochrome P450